MGIIVGLTGGSGAGKTVVSAALAAKGAGWVDADAVYHGLCTPGSELLRALEAAFGDVLTPEGALDRPALAKKVFSDKAALAQLNAITTPRIRAAMAQRAEELFAAGHPVVLYDAPTLFQTGIDADCACVIGVIADRATRMARIMARDGLSEQAAAARIGNQPDSGFYRARCDFIIENNGTAEAAAASAEALWDSLISYKE